MRIKNIKLISTSFQFRYQPDREEEILEYFKQSKVIDISNFKLMNAFKLNPKFVAKLPLTYKLYTDLFFSSVHDVNAYELLYTMHDVTFGQILVSGVGDIGELIIEASAIKCVPSDPLHDREACLLAFLREQEERIDSLVKKYARGSEESEVFKDISEALREYIYLYMEEEKI